MTENTKFLLKPKVRFSQTSDNEQEASKEKLRTGKPKIRSIVTVKTPVRIVQKTENSEVPNMLKEQNEKPSEHWNKPLCLGTSAESDENPCEKSSNVNVKEANSGALKSEKSLKNISPHASVDSLPSSKTLNVKLLQEKDNVISNTQKHLKQNVNKSCKGKENQKSVLKKKMSGTVVLMPCHKYKQIMPKTKTSSVKKTVVRDIHGRGIKPYVGPGVPRDKRDLETPMPKDKTLQTKSDVTSSEKLAHPEYNSIRCTINKLNEVKSEKIVTDIAHLPQSYKNLINGKVSNALDFPMSEAIYKNLVDLSIDEKQLPNRLVRTKDPEPRQKDIVPSLSDFFTPFTIEEEYCISASVKPRIPEAVNSWDAFAISDKILEWKYNMDNE